MKKIGPLKNSGNIQHSIEVGIGHQAIPVGKMSYVKQGTRENSVFVYESTWLSAAKKFSISPDLELISDFQYHRAPTSQDSVFHGAIADTAPDSWGRKVISRAHAKRRLKENLPPLSEVDYLMAVDDFSRIGALRLKNSSSINWGTSHEGRSRTPPLLDLQMIFEASHAVELNNETISDLRFLEGKGTSLGGLRPKCTILDRDNSLSLGKFPSVGDERPVTRCEVLALHLAALAGIDVPYARLEILPSNTPVAIIRRFDRTVDDWRIPYLSAASLLQASRQEDRSYFEIADAIKSTSPVPVAELHQLWRRLVFNLLITNIDDHLHNMGFLHVEHGHWRLAPAFDLNPFPDKNGESKTWLSEEDGPITEISNLVERAFYFSLNKNQALKILKEVVSAVLQWRIVGSTPAIGLSPKDLAELTPAFNHPQLLKSKSILS